MRCAHHFRSPWLDRFLRGEVARWFAAIVLIPILAMGNLCGAKFVSHGHDDLGVHLHALAFVGALGHADHAEDHGHDHGHDHGVASETYGGDAEWSGEHDPLPPCVVVSLGDHQQSVG
jgi:hypothetical protein